MQNLNLKHTKPETATEVLEGKRKSDQLQIRNLKTIFRLANGQEIHAVDRVNFEISPGEIVGLVGESGSGKTVFCLSILRLVPPPGKIVEGEILWNNRNLLLCNEQELKEIRGKEITMIFQTPASSYCPFGNFGPYSGCKGAITFF